jgi:hypothetical protein
MRRRAANALRLPSPTADHLARPECYVDNEMQASTTDLAFFSLALRAGVHKRCGHDARVVLFGLLIWPLLAVRSVHTFLGATFGQLCAVGKDALYELLARLDVNWREHQWQLARRLIQRHRLLNDPITALVGDDTVKTRRGRKMEGVSAHFDHLQHRTVLGEQMLQLGLATPRGFVPLDEQLYISSKKEQKLRRPFADKRCPAARRWAEAHTSKIEMVRAMIRRAVRYGVRARYFLADAWFGCREVIAAAVDAKLVAVIRMKRGNLKYRYRDEELTADELYARFVKGQMSEIESIERQAATLDVVLDLDTTGASPRPMAVRLLFVRGLDPDAGKKDWALFLTTDTSLTAARILEVYALRWGVEVYFKEAKQNLGLLKEQTWTFAAHTASTHLTAMRYLLILHRVLERGGAFAEVRDELTGKLRALSMAQVLWALFRALIAGALDRLRLTLGDFTIRLVQTAIDTTVLVFLESVLQLDTATLADEDLAPDAA